MSRFAPTVVVRKIPEAGADEKIMKHAKSHYQQ